MPFDGKPGAFFAADNDLVLADQLADILEADRRLVDRYAVFSGHGIDQMGGGDTAGHTPFQFAHPDQVIQEQGNDVVGLDEGAIAIQDAETVGVAVGCQPQTNGRVAFDQRDKIGNMTFGRLGRMAAEVGIEVVVNDNVRDAALLQRLIQIPPAGAVQGIERHFPEMGNGIKVNLLFQRLQIPLPGVDALQEPLARRILQGKGRAAGRA